jgi:hypothetical protein
LLLSFALSCEEGAGKTGCRLAPMIRCAKNLHTQMRRRVTGGPENTRPSLRDGLTAYACSPRSRIPSGLRRLANWRWSETRLSLKPSPQGLTVATTVRTTWFCRTQLILLRPEASPDFGAVRSHGLHELTRFISPCPPHPRRRCRVHRPPAHVRDDVRSPLSEGPG